MSRYVHLDDEDVLVYHAYKESQLFHFNEPSPGIFIAESPTVIKRALKAGYEPESFLVEKEQLSKNIESIMEPYEAPVFICSYEELKNLTGYHMSRGMLCAFKRKPNPDIASVCENKSKIVVLENTMNPTNIGAIVRSAAALNIEAVLLTKGCADPLQRRASRVSMGNIFAMPWAYMDSHTVDTKLLNNLGFTTISMALTDDAVDIDKISLSGNEKIAILMGTEGEGLNMATIVESDIVAKIPMSNNVDSLNVAAASAVAFWELTR